MKNTILIGIILLWGINTYSQKINFELKDIDTARVYNFHPDCNGANNAGVWEAENLVVLTENLYPTDLNYETMLVFVNFFDALFETYVDITSSPNLPIDGGFGAYNGKPTYHITTDMCPGYAGAASHGVLGNATGMGFFDLSYDRIESGDTSFCQVYTYEMHRNFWWGTDVWCEKIGWYVDNNPAAWGHWTLACNVANGSLLTNYLGVGVFEDPPYNDSEAFYHRNVDPFLYYLEHPEYNFDNNWLHGLINYDWLPDTRGVNNLMTGLFIYSYENFGGLDWERGFYTWLQSDEIIPD
ncbi:hypothetical protein N9934_03080, partial [Desulfosarcina sp.]|nr:hypothetical protein [Desulfosarcina sp.]